MKRVICNSKYNNEKWLYHCTDSEETAKSIIDSGYLVPSKEFDFVCVTDSVYNAQGYGPVTLRCKASILNNLRLVPVNRSASLNIDDYPSGTQGLYEPVHLDADKYIFYIFDYSLFNWHWERYPEGDRK